MRCRTAAVRLSPIGRRLVMPDGDPIILGHKQDCDSQTTIYCTGKGVPAFGEALFVENDTGSAVEGKGNLGGTGVRGTSDTSAGVVGRSGSATGVAGEAIGIHSAGLTGTSDTGWGVIGRVDDGRASNTAGVQGLAFHGTAVRGTSLDGRAVDGLAWAGDAVWGRARGGVGVHGESEDSDGVRGISPQVGVRATGLDSGIGIRAMSTNGHGLVASSTSGNAALFLGQVLVSGRLIVFGAPKSAAVPHPDGTHRLTYCTESPESWFEDFGRARLSRGRAEVRLDPDFAALIQTDDFHVFLTAEDETRGLYVADRSEAGFAVREQRGGDGDVTFSYRVVARRRDVDAGRLASVDIPEIPPEPEMVTPVDLPDQPVLPPVGPSWQSQS
jgi:hypothetical protein